MLGKGLSSYPMSLSKPHNRRLSLLHDSTMGLVAHLDDSPPSGGPLPARLIPPGHPSCRVGTWDDSHSDLVSQWESLDIDSLGRYPARIPHNLVEQRVNAHIRVHNKSYVADRVLPLSIVINVLNLHQLMEPFLLVDEHQVIISVCTVWLTYLLVIDGTGATSSSVQDLTNPYLLPTSISDLASPPGFIRRLQGPTYQTLVRRTWMASYHRTYTFSIHFSTSAEVVILTTRDRIANWTWSLCTPVLPPFPHAPLDLEAFSDWGRDYSPLPSGTMGYWVHPSPLEPELPASMGPAEGARFTYMATPPVTSSWSFVGHEDFTRPLLQSGETWYPRTAMLFDMTDSPFDLWIIRLNALNSRDSLPLVLQPAYLSLSSTRELEWALLRVGNHGGHVDRLCPTYLPLRSLTLQQLLSPYEVRAGGRYQVTIVSRGLVVLIAIFLAPTITFTSDGRPAHRHVQQSGLNCRLFDGVILTMPGFLDWLTRDLEIRYFERISLTPRAGTILRLSIHPHDSSGLMEIGSWDPEDLSVHHLLQQRFPSDPCQDLTTLVR